MTPVSQLCGPSREHLAWPLFDSRHSEYASCAFLKARPKFRKLIIGRDVLKVDWPRGRLLASCYGS